MIDAKDKLKGIYAITPPKFDETKLLNDINICLGCGIKIFQIRYKEEITRELKDFFSVLIKQIKKKDRGPVIFMSPQGEKLDQKKVKSFSKLKNITIICGRYEGIDQRVIDKYVDEEISIGDFILSGGEYAAVCLIDAITRHIPGTLGNEDSYLKDTFSNGLLKGDVYAKPESFESMKVPDVLLSGNHKEIDSWREHNSLLKTFIKRPELLNDVKLTKKQKKLLEEWASKDIL